MTPRSDRRRLSLTGYLFLAYVVLLAAALFAAGALWTAHNHREVRKDYEQRAMTVAQSVAALPTVRDYLADDRADTDIASFAEAIRRASGFRYIVIGDANGIRHSHPNSAAIGERPRTDPAPVLAGDTWTGVKRGPAGVTLRARAPIHHPTDDSVIGFVSVGVLSSDVALATATALPTIAGTILLVLVSGACGAYVISRRIRAKTHGLEPSEITELLEGREALLYAIAEGVLAVGADGRVILANQPARAMLGLPANCVGYPPEQLDMDERLREILHGKDTRSDLFIAVGGRMLVCNHRPVRLNGVVAGLLVTLRDHTEIARLGGELDGVRTMASGLRAQTHEFANRIHTVSGMLELGAVTEAREYLSELSTTTTRVSATVSQRIGDVALAALILAKSAQAAEQGADFELAALTDVPAELGQQERDDVLLIVGNLVDNALDAVGDSGFVELLVREHRLPTEDPTEPSAAPPEGATAHAGPQAAAPTVPSSRRVLEIRVTDSGPGVRTDLGTDVFAAGVSTKGSADDGRRGLGLALVQQACARWGGAVEVDSSEETVFSAYLPFGEPG